MTIKTVALVPARGGSKSIPLKNIKEICGQPLLYWGLLALEKSQYIDIVYVATDSREIKEVVLTFNFKKVVIYDRLPANAQDHSSTEDLMLEFLEWLDLPDYDQLILLQATTPYTTHKDLDKALEQFWQEDFDSLLSCGRTKRFIWNEEGTPQNYDYKCRPRRQDFDGTLIENGAFYISTVGGVKKTKCRLNGRIGIYEMAEYTLTELDEPEDWYLAEMLLQRNKAIAIQQNPNMKKIKLFLSDIDGVLTDAGMYYTEFGDELKKFSTYDGKAFELLRDKNVITGLITSEKVQLNERRAKKIKIDRLFQGVCDKVQVARQLCFEYGVSFEEIAYIGDDVGDIELLSKVGVAACPANAMAEVKGLLQIMELKSKGGEGAVREFVNFLIASKRL
ncbi:cytidylyltransferase domain-containing protein [Pontibacter sp. CAU 1760]